MARDPELQWAVEQHDGIGLMTLNGDLLAKTRLDPERVLREWVDHDILKIIIDCIGLQQIDSAGLSVLMGPIPRARRRGGDVVLAQINPHMKALFQVATFRKYFKVFDTVADAEAYLAPLKLTPLQAEAIDSGKAGS